MRFCYETSVLKGARTEPLYLKKEGYYIVVLILGPQGLQSVSESTSMLQGSWWTFRPRKRYLPPPFSKKPTPHTCVKMEPFVPVVFRPVFYYVFHVPKGQMVTFSRGLP